MKRDSNPRTKERLEELEKIAEKMMDDLIDNQQPEMDMHEVDTVVECMKSRMMVRMVNTL